jgi:CubicO group peptidase (beta-lactamase class C family)
MNHRSKDKHSKMVSWATAASVLLCLSYQVCADAPYIDPEDDAENYGDISNLLFWNTAQKVSGFRNYRYLAEARRVAAGPSPGSLHYAPRELGSFSFEFNGATMSLDDYIRHHNIAGLLVIQDGTIVYERYELGNTADTLWLSWSIAKSVTSLLVGAALHDGYIASIDEKVSDYLPRLKDSSYDDVTIRHLMQMSSGVAWDEDYADPESDINTIEWDTLSIYEQLRHKPRVAEPGEVFSYNTAETNLVGTLLRSAIGNNLSTYLSEKIWRPFGMQADAYWTLSEPGGGEHGGSNLSATLRDYGRIGLFALNDGVLPDGSRVLPQGWMAASTSPSPGADTYGYLWWLGADGVFAASGIFGQAIRIDPVSKIVIAQHSAREAASRPDDWALQAAFFQALVSHLSN